MRGARPIWYAATSTSPPPNVLWVADTTYIPTGEGFLYLAVVLDVFSRRIVGWAMSNHLYTELMLRALNMALLQRRPEGVIHHSDQAAQHTSIAFGRRCHEAGVQPSMGTAGDAYDNAMCESFFGTLEAELLVREHFATHEQARTCIFWFLEGSYNVRRLAHHSNSKTGIRRIKPHHRAGCAPPGSVIVVTGDPPPGGGQPAIQ
nr:IS3 family transposase [Paraburkholderia sp. BL27I4N3]